MRYAVVFVVALLAVPVGTQAQAHGAPQNPISRILVCDPAGGPGRTGAACKAAVAAGADVADWDNVRVANVDGKDRSRIPDGSLCSGGIARYRGLDLARKDWPATTLTPGASYQFTYRTSIPHAGSFRLFVTTDSYDPARPLRWSDLEQKPFLTATDPPVRKGAYVMPGRLPSGKTGRHIIYTIWQNSSTPDTYYSCSDVVFRAAVATTPPAVKTTRPTVVKTTQPPATPLAAAPVSNPKDTNQPGTLIAIAIAIAVVVATVVAVGLWLGTRRRRPRRH